MNQYPECKLISSVRFKLVQRCMNKIILKNHFNFFTRWHFCASGICYKNGYQPRCSNCSRLQVLQNDHNWFKVVFMMHAITGQGWEFLKFKRFYYSLTFYFSKSDLIKLFLFFLELAKVWKSEKATFLASFWWTNGDNRFEMNFTVFGIHVTSFTKPNSFRH